MVARTTSGTDVFPSSPHTTPTPYRQATKQEKTKRIDELVSRIPQHLRGAFAESTNRRHAALLLEVMDMRERFPQETEAQLALRVVEDHNKSTPTQRTTLGNVIGAMRYSELMGVEALKPVNIAQDIVVKRYTRGLNKMVYKVAGEVRVYTVLLQEVQEVLDTIRARRDPLAAMAEMYIWLWWNTASRSGDAILLLSENIVHHANGTSIRFVEGKTVALVGPYTTHTALMPAHLRKQLPHRGPVFLTSLRMPIQRLVTEVAKTVNRLIESRSWRRGALVTMSLNGATEEELLSFSQHKDVWMLRRYLGWGMESKHRATTGARTAQALSLSFHGAE